MSNTLVVCKCGEVQENVVTFCEEHHIYRRGLKQLTSVTQVIRQCWPIKKNFEDADPAVLENARERGLETDWLFSAWLGGKLSRLSDSFERFPQGPRQDAVDRFQALVKWYKTAAPFTSMADPQVMLADDDIAGTTDFTVTIKGLPWVFDLKNVSALDPSYNVQLGAYADLYEAQYGVSPAGAALIHVTQPKGKPVSVKYVEIDLPRARQDWKAIRAVWNIAKRLNGNGR